MHVVRALIGPIPNTQNILFIAWYGGNGAIIVHEKLEVFVIESLVIKVVPTQCAGDYRFGLWRTILAKRIRREGTVHIIDAVLTAPNVEDDLLRVQRQRAVAGCEAGNHVL